jgi:(1->4)-alpha-D-glucan 1-alpha-D-glucosylmutase
VTEKTPLDGQLVERIRHKTARMLAERWRNPGSTYRLQFHSGFTFRDAARIAPYLSALGVTHCYASPYLKARPGSTHGYDIVDHGSLNPEIGSEEDYNAWIAALAENGLRQIADIVPNHMGVGSNDNAWWNDVLENGPASRFAGYFDIAWRASARPELQDKVLLPVLGEPYGEALEAGQLPLRFENGALSVYYFERRFPLDPGTFGIVIAHRLEELQLALGPDAPAFLEYQSILTASRNLPARTETDAQKVAERSREKEIIKRRLADLTTDCVPIRDFIEQNLAVFNGQPGTARSFDLLHNLLEQQCFRLSYWRVALDEINYRRFFDVNELAALSIEREDVFAAVHALVLRLAAEGKIDGLRIDHPDGLYDPAQYFRRLQEHFALACARVVVASDPEFATLDAAQAESALRELAGVAAVSHPHPRPLSQGERGEGEDSARWPLYVVAEKILGAGEQLAENWAVHGTSGYDFLNVVNGLFVDTANEDAFSRLYCDLIGDAMSFPETAFRKKLLILQASLASELHMSTHQLDRLAQKSRASRDFTFHTLRIALRAVIACFPVYRSYIAADELHDEDRRNIQLAVRRATLRNPLVSRRVFQFIRGMLLLEAPAAFTAADQAEQRRFAGKFQQVTAPVMAKGIEDTAFYVYNRLLSLNEVGGDANRFGVTPDALHAYFRERQAKWPFALSPLSTHDTKRSEDVRARLNVLSEMPVLWRQCIERWSRLNQPLRQQVEDLSVPDANEEYLLYQTLVGAWPLRPGTPEEWADFVKRIQAYMEKATREAKTHTSWIHPDADYDRAIANFVERVLDENASRPFLDDFRAFQQRISQCGLMNSLAQTLLKLTAPGVPDTYQGTEVWDFSLVDPDNRRLVDYSCRQKMLKQMQADLSDQAHMRQVARDLLATRADGRIKMYVTLLALHCRRDNPELFANGQYVPLKTAGEKGAHLFSFARNAGDQSAIVAVPRQIAQLTHGTSEPPLGLDTWADTHLCLDGVPPGLRWRNVFTGSHVVPVDSKGNSVLAASDLMADFPVVLLLGDRAN